MEMREDFMVSPVGDSKPTLRAVYFLKPLAAESLEGRVPEVLSVGYWAPFLCGEKAQNLRSPCLT